MLQLEVLSGGLSGRTFSFDKSEVRLGRHPACEVVFDALRDDSVGRWHAHLRAEGDQWSVENLHENGTFLNGKPVTGKLMIRGGDSLRLARDGPEIRVAIVAPAPGDRPVELPLARERPVSKPFLPPRRVLSNASFNVMIGLSAAGIGLVTLLVVLVVPRLSSDKDKSNSASDMEVAAPDELRQHSDVSLDALAGPTLVRQTSPERSREAEAAQNDGRTPRQAKETGRTDAWQTIVERNRRSVYAVAAEDPKGLGMWPMGTAFAIRADALVTTASVATQLDALRREGWKAWALGPGPNAAQEIANIQVHVGFVRSAEKPESQAFFDLALLTLSAGITEFCQVASDQEIATVDARQPFGCLAISVSIGDPPEPMGRFDVLVPELTTGKIQGLLALSRDLGAPRMLLLPASMPAHIWGSPVFNERGSVVAVCTEAAQKTGTTQVRLNYAPLVTSVADWLKGLNQEVWVPVTLSLPESK